MQEWHIEIIRIWGGGGSSYSVYIIIKRNEEDCQRVLSTKEITVRCLQDNFQEGNIRMNETTF